jgi:endoglucanase
MTEKDLDRAVWALNGREGAGYGRTFGAVESFGVLNPQRTASASDPYTAARQALIPAYLGR